MYSGSGKLLQESRQYRPKWYYRIAGTSGVLIAAAHRPTLPSKVPHYCCNWRHRADCCRKSIL
jgi:hypothetical protein